MPDDFSGTYVINVENNSTRTFPPPTVKDTKSSYLAGVTSLLQLDSTGAVSFIPYVSSSSSAKSSAAWSNVKGLAVVAPPGSSPTPDPPVVTGAGSNSNTKTSQSDGALSNHAVTSGLVGLSVLFAILGFL